MRRLFSLCAYKKMILLLLLLSILFFYTQIFFSLFLLLFWLFAQRNMQIFGATSVLRTSVCVCFKRVSREWAIR